MILQWWLFPCDTEIYFGWDLEPPFFFHVLWRPSMCVHLIILVELLVHVSPDAQAFIYSYHLSRIAARLAPKMGQKRMVLSWNQQIERPRKDER